MNKKQSVITTEQWPRPEDFPIGSLESRAAARALLDSRQKQRYTRVPVHYEGFGDFEHIVDRTRIVKTIGHVPTLEEFLAHPMLQNIDTAQLNLIAGRPKQQQQQRLESVQPRVAPQVPDTLRVDPLAAVRRRRFKS